MIKMKYIFFSFNDIINSRYVRRERLCEFLAVTYTTLVKFNYKTWTWRKFKQYYRIHQQNVILFANYDILNYLFVLQGLCSFLPMILWNKGTKSLIFEGHFPNYIEVANHKLRSPVTQTQFVKYPTENNKLELILWISMHKYKMLLQKMK